MTTSVTVTVAGHQVAVTERRVTEGEVGHNVDDVVTTMRNTGETQTFYAHSSQKLLIEETGEASISAVEQMNVSGSARELGAEDFAKTNQAG